MSRSFIKLFLAILVLVGLLQAGEFSRGEKIYRLMCEKDELKKISAKTIEELNSKLISSSACGKLKPKQYMVLSEYYWHTYLHKEGKTHRTELKISPPKRAKCKVCGMFVSKYPNWVTSITLKDSVTSYFDGVKDMMKFYLSSEEYGVKKEDIKELFVSDYYSLDAIDAKKAWYVTGSNVYGPMGHEFIPFKTKDDAEAFKRSHYGKKVLKFDEITLRTIVLLD